MASYYYPQFTSSSTSATTGNAYYPIGITNSSQPIGWNGTTRRIVASAPIAPARHEGPLDWLRRRVDEVCVDVMEIAA